MTRIIYLLFTVSGFIGLTYEALWARYLKLLLGHSAYGQILTLVIYMGGLGIGSFIGAKLCKKMRNPFFLYAAIELLVGIAALFYHNTYLLATGLYYHASFFQHTGFLLNVSAKIALAAVITGPAAVLLGMTFPALAVALMRYKQDGGKKTLSFLYFFNSLGAAAGIICTSYFTIARLGTNGTLVLSGFANILIAVAFYLIARAVVVPADAKPYAPALPASGSLSAAVFAWLALSALTGFSSFLYEIGWIRLISLLLGSATHSFDIMISAFILGLAFGGLYSKKILRTGPAVPFALGIVQMLMGTFALCSIYLYKPLFAIINSFHQIFVRTELSYGIVSAVKYFLCLLLMGPTTFFAGMTLPLITYWLLSRTGDEKFTGSVYGWNTIGSIAGAFMGGVVILPALQLKYTLGAGALIDIALGLVILYRCNSRRYAFPLAAAAMVIAALPLFMVHFDSLLLNSGVFRYYIQDINDADRNTTWNARDGRTATISFFQLLDGTKRTLKTNGKTDASLMLQGNRIVMAGDELTQAALAYYPMAVFDRPYTAAIIGFGSGRTAYHLLSDPMLKDLEIVEIEPEVVNLARGFMPFNKRAYEDPRAKIVIADAKTYFFVNDKSYDLIVSEPSNPWVSGVSSLYTLEFYRHCSGFLRSGGILVQWLHTYEFNSELLLSIIKAMDSVFPQIKIFQVPHPGYPDMTDIVLIAGKQDFSLSFLDRFSTTGSIKADLDETGTRPEFFGLQNYLLSTKTLQPILDNYRPNSDFHPYVDNGAEKAFFLKQTADLFTPFIQTLSFVQDLSEPQEFSPAYRETNRTNGDLMAGMQINLKSLDCVLAGADSSADWNQIDSKFYATVLQYPSADFWKTSGVVALYRQKCNLYNVLLQSRLKFQFIDAVMQGDHTTAIGLLGVLVKVFKQNEIGVNTIRTAEIEALRSGNPRLADEVFNCFIKRNFQLTGYEKMLYQKLAEGLQKR
jgi:spermidine synthase